MEIDGNIFKLEVSNEFNKGIIKDRYYNLIKNALYHVTDMEYELEILVGDTDEK